MRDIKPKTRKRIYDEYIGKLFLNKETFEKLQQEMQFFKIGDLGRYHHAYKGLEGSLDAYDTGEAGTHKGSIIYVRFSVTKKGKEKASYNVYLKYPLTEKANEHIGFNTHYYKESLEDKVTLVPISGGGNTPVTYTYSEYGGKALSELKSSEWLEDAIILSYSLGVSVETIKEVFGGGINKILRKFANPKKPTRFTLMDTLVKFPAGYLPKDKRKEATEELKRILRSDTKLKNLIVEGKNYKDSDVTRAIIVGELAHYLDVTERYRNVVPPEHKGKKNGLTHRFEEYEGCLQKGINRILEETSQRVAVVRTIYKNIENKLTNDLNNRESVVNQQPSIKHIVEGQLSDLRRIIESVEKDATKFENFKKKYQNAFENLPTVSCPVDLIAITKNLRIAKRKSANGKIIAQTYLIDQWLPKEKTFLDLRGSPVTVYYMIKHVTSLISRFESEDFESGNLESEKPGDIGVKRLLKNVCRALEKEFVADDAKTKYWLDYRGDLEKIVKTWHFWRNKRSIADRFREDLDESLRDAVEEHRYEQQLKPIADKITYLISHRPYLEINQIRVEYVTEKGERKIKNYPLITPPLSTKDMKNFSENLLKNFAKDSPAPKIISISFLRGRTILEIYDVLEKEIMKKRNIQFQNV